MGEETVIMENGELSILMKKLSGIFDLVRLTDPETFQRFDLLENGELAPAEGYCYDIFGHTEKCENCTGHAACVQHRRQAKIEKMGELHPLVLSVPVSIKNGEEDVRNIVLEAMIRNPSELLASPVGDGGSGGVAEDRRRLYNDALTGAYNRYYYEELRFVNERGCPVAFLYTDVRQFKKINDVYGHPVGDETLKKTAEVMKSNVRSTDSVIRMGGDEFLIVLYHCNLADAEKVAEKINNELATGTVYDSEKGLAVRVNVGISCRESFDGTGKTVKEMYEEADKVMYAEKNSMGDE